MPLATMHPEDVKAAIRKRFTSVAEFERANDLPTKSVNDLLRGRKSKRVVEAIEKLITCSERSEYSDGSDDNELPHRLNAGVR
jgi:lambda repressor-like predicted transcriptional regulator